MREIADNDPVAFNARQTAERMAYFSREVLHFRAS